MCECKGSESAWAGVWEEVGVNRQELDQKRRRSVGPQPDERTSQNRMLVWGLWVRGGWRLNVGVWDLGLRVEGLRFWVQGCELGAQTGHHLHMESLKFAASGLKVNAASSLNNPKPQTLINQAESSLPKPVQA